jgi:hypothetical protein
MTIVKCVACGYKKAEIKCKVCKKDICSGCKGRGTCHGGRYGTVKQTMNQHRRGSPPRQKSQTTKEGYPITHEHDGKDRYDF